jgi:hypothetical protein
VRSYGKRRANLSVRVKRCRVPHLREFNEFQVLSCGPLWVWFYYSRYQIKKISTEEDAKGGQRDNGDGWDHSSDGWN